MHLPRGVKFGRRRPKNSAIGTPRACAAAVGNQMLAIRRLWVAFAAEVFVEVVAGNSIFKKLDLQQIAEAGGGVRGGHRLRSARTRIRQMITLGCNNFVDSLIDNAVEALFCDSELSDWFDEMVNSQDVAVGRRGACRVRGHVGRRGWIMSCVAMKELVVRREEVVPTTTKEGGAATQRQGSAIEGDDKLLAERGSDNRGNAQASRLRGRNAATHET
ncbi:hypothetical protein ZIOFF_022864 [Zingiber officinale]|uniref:Uncharacterized protein n=1 Tax=Zingiber officinale TaxID=94328 RepID=A0A8J5H253_ZINOF|nr:hypothetical protein ZIOFF_022864 [Zingiber officinale]